MHCCINIGLFSIDKLTVFKGKGKGKRRFVYLYIFILSFYFCVSCLPSFGEIKIYI